jgi:hypothetical protein
VSEDKSGGGCVEQSQSKDLSDLKAR